MLQAFFQLKEECFKHLCGAFSFILLNTLNKEIYCVRDHLGMKPIYFSFENNAFCFATEPKFIFQLTTKKRALNERKLISIITRNDNYPSQTLFQGINRVEKGNFIKIVDGKLQNHVYHQFQKPSYINYDNEKDYVDLFQETFTKVIEDQINGFNTFGTTLSGGLDSTAVSRTAAKINRSLNPKKNIISFSYQFSELESCDFSITDEMKYVKDAVSMGGLDSKIVEIKKSNCVKELIEAQNRFPSPCFQGNRYQELLLIKACQNNNINMLLTGFDGDCTVSYGMEQIQILINQGKIFEALSLNKKTRENRGLQNNALKIVYNYIFLKYISPEIHLLIKKIKGFKNYEFQYKFLKSSFTDNIDHLEVLRKNRELMFDTECGHMNLLNSNHFQNVFESLDIDYSYGGIEERHPFCDKRLMELCLNIPPTLKLKDGYTRYILREAMKKDFPTSIQTRMTKSDLSPYFFYSADQQMKELITRLIQTNSKLQNYLNKKILERYLSKINLLTPEDKTWIVNLCIIDEWIIKNVP